VHERFGHITPAPCAAHCIDLCLEDICKLEHAKFVYENAKDALQFVRNHDRLLAEFKEHTTKAIIIPGNTRFKHVYTMLGRALDIKSAMRKTIVCDAFEELLHHGKPQVRQHAEDVKHHILDDELWRHAMGLVAVGKPLCELLDFTNASVR